MPTFCFEAMGPTGETQTGQVEAATSGEAAQMLRERGLFVTKLTETTDSSDDGASESPATAWEPVSSEGSEADTDQSLQGQRVGSIVVAVGLVCAAAGLYGVVDSALYSIRGESLEATVVDINQGGDDRSDILGFSVSGHQYRVDARGSFGVIWAPSHGLGSRHGILYMPQNPADARLAAFMPRFFIPLFLLGFGSALVGCGVLIRRHGWRPA